MFNWFVISLSSFNKDLLGCIVVDFIKATISDVFTSDSFINKVTGLSYVKPGSLKDLENSIKYFYFNQSKINLMGKNAKKLINSNFNPKKNLKVLINIYESALKST